MRNRVCILTATRAEYGLLRNIIFKFAKDSDIDLRIVVTGMHLCEEFGLTYREIEKDGLVIDEKIPILLSTDDSESISSAMGMALIHFGHYFSRIKPNMLIVLGDRYETLAVCIAAMNDKIPIAHIHGGEITEGAIDDAVRHSITKMSYLHFTSTMEYRNRVIQLGEDPERVFWVGAPGVENVLKAELFDKKEIERELGVSLSKPYFLVTFHPVTLKNEEKIQEQIENLIEVVTQHPEYLWIFTKANADAGGRLINKRLEEVSVQYDHVKVYASLGMKRYLSTMKYSEAVVGNTSSGILEAPSFHIPTINIGNRQKGRVQAGTVINCKVEKSSIEEAIKTVTEDNFKIQLKGISNPYYRENTSERIYHLVREFLQEGKINLEKKFYNVEVEK